MLDIIKNKHFLPNIKPTLYFVPNSKLFPQKKKKKKKKEKRKKKKKRRRRFIKKCSRVSNKVLKPKRSKPLTKTLASISDNSHPQQWHPVSESS